MDLIGEALGQYRIVNDLASGDDAQQGKDLLEEARSTFQRLGAQRDLDEVQEKR